MFGDSARDDGTVAVGTGVHAFRDPALVEDFSADPVALDVGEPHTYARRVVAGRGGLRARRSHVAAHDPVAALLGAAEIAVFDHPGRGPRPQVPELVVRSVVVDSDEVVDGAARPAVGPPAATG